MGAAVSRLDGRVQHKVARHVAEGREQDRLLQCVVVASDIDLADRGIRFGGGRASP